VLRPNDSADDEDLIVTPVATSNRLAVPDTVSVNVLLLTFHCALLVSVVVIDVPDMEMPATVDRPMTLIVFPSIDSIELCTVIGSDEKATPMAVCVPDAVGVVIVTAVHRLGSRARLFPITESAPPDQSTP